jgi:cAMP phosphodiesterase
MFGHLSPPGIMHELKTLASLVGGDRLDINEATS